MFVLQLNLKTSVVTSLNPEKGSSRWQVEANITELRPSPSRRQDESAYDQLQMTF